MLKSSLLFFLGILLATSTFGDESTGCPPPSEQIINLANFAPFTSNRSCNLPVRTSVLVNKPADESPTGVSQRYRVTRKTENDYLVELRVEFRGEDRSLEQSLKQRAEKCFEDVAPYLKGPNGKTLKIRYSDDGTLPLNRVAIVGEEIRPDSGHYNKSVECPTILHETLHLLGLVDEYAETKIGYYIDPSIGKPFETQKLAFDCRALGPNDSIMNTQERAFASVKPGTLAEFQICKCQIDRLACIKRYDSEYSLKKACPSGFIKATRSDDSWTISPSETRNPAWADGDFAPRQKPKLTSIPPKKDSLLLPAHFRMITEPDCILANSLYVNCAQGAYATSVEHQGKGCPVNLPKSCLTPGDAWLK